MQSAWGKSAAFGLQDWNRPRKRSNWNLLEGLPRAKSQSRSGVAPGVQAPGVRGDSQREMKTCSARMVVRSPEPATVGLNNRSADTKPHTGTVFLGRKESVEYLASLVGGKSDASVFDRYQKPFV